MQARKAQMPNRATKVGHTCFKYKQMWKTMMKWKLRGCIKIILMIDKSIQIQHNITPKNKMVMDLLKIKLMPMKLGTLKRLKRSKSY